jgi:nucleoside-diphosphate-sugar epimerase
MTERVLVTGGSGRLGTQVVTDLTDHGHEVVAVDRLAPPQQLPLGARFRQVDLADVGEITGAMKGCTAFAHLGAIPSPYRHADEVVFTNNTIATFSVLQAASLLGLTHGAIASSASAYGTAWSPHRMFHPYAPVDEAAPLRNFDAYGLSKEVDERTAEMFCRRDRISIACLRFHWVAREEEIPQRSGRFYHDEEQFQEGGRGFWGYVDLRDAARAVRLAVEVSGAEPFGFQPFNIMGADTLLDIPTEDAIRRLSPEIELRGPLPGFASAFDCSKAKAMLGWEPEFGWRD